MVGELGPFAVYTCTLVCMKCLPGLLRSFMHRISAPAAPPACLQPGLARGRCTEASRLRAAVQRPATLHVWGKESQLPANSSHILSFFGYTIEEE